MVQQHLLLLSLLFSKKLCLLPWGTRESLGLLQLFLQRQQLFWIISAQNKWNTCKSDQNYSHMIKDSFITSTQILLAKISVLALFKVNGTELNTLTFYKRIEKSYGKECGCLILLQAVNTWEHSTYSTHNESVSQVIDLSLSWALQDRKRERHGGRIESVSVTSNDSCQSEAEKRRWQQETPGQSRRFCMLRPLEETTTTGFGVPGTCGWWPARAPRYQYPPYQRRGPSQAHAGQTHHR